MVGCSASLLVPSSASAPDDPPAPAQQKDDSKPAESKAEQKPARNPLSDLIRQKQQAGPKDGSPPAATKDAKGTGDERKEPPVPAAAQPADEAKPADTKDADAKKPARNPLSDLIRQKQGGVDPPTANGKDSRREANARRSVVDPRAPARRKVDEWLSRAATMGQAGQWKEAFELLQRVSEQPEDTLYRTPDGKWVSAWAEADRVRGTAPPERLHEYQAQFSGLARQLLSQALAAHDDQQLGQVARKYFHTDAGYEAANRLASLHLDRGDFTDATRWVAALWNVQAPVTREAPWRAKAAYAAARAGQTELAEKLAAAVRATPAVSLGGTSRDAAKWLAAAGAAQRPAEPALSQWTTFYGNSSRTGVAAGGTPLLAPRWRRTLSDSLPGRTQIAQLVEDLSDQGTSPSPTLFAMAAAGKIAFRTLRGVEVLDADTGRALWTTAARQPLERLLGAEGAGFGETDESGVGLEVLQGRINIARGGAFWNNGVVMRFGGAGEFSPLGNLLFRNASFGLISSDGSRLFVIDDPAFLTHRQPGNPGQVEMQGADDAGNRLVAYDLATGHPLWTAGGPAAGEPFDPPLAGCYFFGPPLAYKGDLYVVAEVTEGERADEIRLFALDPQTGTERWSQLIAQAPVAIEKDVGRRWWTAQVAVDAGMIVCPTTAGWLVAIDRATRSLLWGYCPQAPTGQDRRGAGFGEQLEAAAMTPQTPLSAQWGAAPPILADGRVVYSVQGGQTLVCLDQYSGKEVWSKPRANGMYLAGVFDHKVLVVERDAVSAYELLSGKALWKSAKLALPSGRGVGLADRYVIPLSSGEVWSLSLADGKAVHEAHVPSDSALPGNLITYGGMLLALDAGGLTAFEQREAIVDEIARRQSANPRDAWAAVREAEMHARDQRYGEALRSLRLIGAAEVPADLRPRYRGLLVESLQEAIRADLTSPQTERDLAELQTIVETADEKQQFRRLETDLLTARGEFGRAFDAYAALAQESPDELITRDDDARTKVQTRLWAAGKLADLFDRVPAERRAELETRLSTRAAAALAAGVDEQREFVALFGRHAIARDVRRRLAQALGDRGEFLAAERLLSEMRYSSDNTVAAAAIEQLARLTSKFDLSSDAAVLYGLLERRYADVVLPSGKTAGRLVEDLRASGDLPLAAPALPDWQAGALRVERLGASNINYPDQELATRTSDAPFFRQFRFEIDHATQRMDMTGGQSDAPLWSLPLRAQSSAAEGMLSLSQASAHQLTIVHRGIIHCLSPVERRVLWTTPLEGRSNAQSAVRRNNSPLNAMQAFSSVAARLLSQPQQQGGGRELPFATDTYVCWQGRRELRVLDAASGEVRWSWSGLRPGMQVIAGRDVVYLRGRDAQKPLALRAADGKRLELPKLADALSRAVAFAGNGFVLPVTEREGKGLRLYDPLLDRDLWSFKLEATELLLSPLDGGRLSLLERSAQISRLHLVDLESGDRKLLGELSFEELGRPREIYSLTDDLNVYLLANRGVESSFYSEGIPFVRASGLLAAFDPEAGKLRWKQQIAAQNLLLERLDASPLLVFASRKTESGGKSKTQYWTLHLVAIDKLSGKKLLDDKWASQPGFRSLSVSASNRYIELRGYNERLRLHPVDRPAVEGGVGE